MAHIDELLGHRLETLSDGQWVSVLIEAKEATWKPPETLRDQVQITSRIKNVFGCLVTKYAINALAQDPGVDGISQ
jgi:hypothetical protein